MKKLVVILLAIMFSGAIISCKTHERCPAYGKANIEGVAENS